MIFAPPAAQPASHRTGACVKCLIVDDVPENLVALQALLKDEDVEILMAGSGAQALELLLAHNDVALAGLNHKMGWRGACNTLLNYGASEHAAGA